jgi:hypothetical protein
MKLTPNSIYQYYWVDIHHDNEWIEKDEVDKKIDEANRPIANVGYFIKEKDDLFVFSSGLASDGDYFDIVVIPRSVIRKVVLIRTIKGRK